MGHYIICKKKEGRIQAINEAYRVLKGRGVLLGFAINYTVSAITGLLNGMMHMTNNFIKCVKMNLKSGVHNPPDNLPGVYCRKPFFTEPQQLKEEVLEGGFIKSPLVCC